MTRASRRAFSQAPSRLGTLASPLGTLASPLGTLASPLGTLLSRLGTLASRLGVLAIAFGAAPVAYAQTAIQPSRSGAFFEDLRSHAAEVRAGHGTTAGDLPQRRPTPRDAALAAARAEAMAPGKGTGTTNIYTDLYQHAYADGYGHIGGQGTVRPYHARPPRRNTASSSFRTDFFPRTTDARNRNFSLGPVDFLLGVAAYAEYDDNVLRRNRDEISDFLFGGLLDVSSSWQISRTSRLDLQVGLGAERYLDHHDELSATGDEVDFFVTPNSMLSLDFFAGDILVNVHDRLSIDHRRQDAFQLDDRDVFGSLENEAGVSILWPINSRTDLAAGYDYFIARSLSDDFEFIDRDAHEFFVSPSYSPHQTWRVGMESGIALVDYIEPTNNDVDSMFVGGFFETPISHYTTIRVGGGYQSLDYESGGLVDDVEDYSGAYGNVAISNQLNKAFRHTLTAGREAGLGVTSNFTLVDYVRYGIVLDPQDGGSLSAGVYYENENDSRGVLSEDRERTGVHARYRRLLTRNLTAGAGGSYSQVSSDIGDRSYDEFTVTADLSYALTRRTLLSLIYRYWTVDADNEDQGFDQNRVMLSVSHSF